MSGCHVISPLSLSFLLAGGRRGGRWGKVGEEEGGATPATTVAAVETTGEKEGSSGSERPGRQEKEAASSPVTK
jgi:hypothetical protein|uniref:Uncharacterized protein n=1 Tax=Oryza sativa subsp. japonica TaxID=39947 RepID=Q6Z3V3_ORYSJ|nr:hypothetical protein [Oryza sativa Japonica Group]BAD30844.1 hypothetical protein [Oryza sativa Japonica Group]